MSIKRWSPPVVPSSREKMILKRCRKTRKLFAFLREHRHEIFDDETQTELEDMYRDTGAGKEPVPPALMAMALILQGYLKVSDAEAVELTAVDLRWQMVLNCLGAETPAFSQGTLFDFRERLIAAEMDRRLLERTARFARSTKGFDARRLPKSLRVAIDSSGLEGAGRVEDTFNLIGHAARKVAECAATLLNVEYDELCRKAGIPILLHASVKKALDRDWSDPEQKTAAIDELAREVLSMERWLEKNLAEEMHRPPLVDLVEVLTRLMSQDLEPDPDGSGTDGPASERSLRIVDGVAPDRQISIEDPEMRHGRKSKSERIDGYKRHIARDLDRDAVVACAITPANAPEYLALDSITSDIAQQNLSITEAHFDRAYMSSDAVQKIIDDGGEIVCKPWKPRNRGLFAKDDFEINMRSRTIECPAGVVASIQLGRTTSFPADECDPCAMRQLCTTAASGAGRTVKIAEDEPLQHRLRKLAKSKRGRERLRERVAVEHNLAHIGYRQGRRARFTGVRKNLFDLRRSAIIQNLEATQRKAA